MFEVDNKQWKILVLSVSARNTLIFAHLILMFLFGFYDFMWYLNLVFGFYLGYSKFLAKCCWSTLDPSLAHAIIYFFKSLPYHHIFI